MLKPNAHLAHLPVYEPGRPVEDVARDLNLDPATIIKLASNENPLGPSPRAIQAIRDAAARSHFYPDGNGFMLRRALAKKLGLDVEQIVLGNGSNELIEFVGHAYLAPGAEMVISQYAFAVYEIVGKMFQATIREVPARDHGHDLAAMRQAITPKTRLIFIANPNNPTGTIISRTELERFILDVPDHCLVVLDEAYQEFLKDPLNTPALIAKKPNLVVMRTFSKAQGLAGLRIGYGVAHRDVAAQLQKVRQPFQANLVAQAAALAALEDEEHIRKTVEVVTAGRSFLEKEFAARKLAFVPSQGNFVLVKVGDGRKVFEGLMREGVIIRHMHGYKLPEWIRVTVGTQEQNQRFLKSLDKVLSS